MLLAEDGATLRFANPDDLDTYALEITHREQGTVLPETQPQRTAAFSPLASTASPPALPVFSSASNPRSSNPVSGTAPPPPALPILSNALKPSPIDRLTDQAVLEETLFLGLRTNDGLSTIDLARSFPASALEPLTPLFQEAERDGLLLCTADRIALTPHGRLLSNELFSRLLAQ